MKLSFLTASTAALLLSSTALLAQDAPAGGQGAFENVFVDVEGSAVQVPAALAAEACGLDLATLQTTAQTRLDEAGLDAAAIPGLVTANAASAAGIDASGGMTDTDANSMDTVGTDTTGVTPSATTDPMGSTAPALGGTASAEASATATASDTATTTTANATSAPAEGSQPAQVDDASTMAAANSPAGTDPAAAGGTATADASASADVSGVGNVESTAAETTVTNAQGAATSGEQYLALTVCQIDLARASDLGIPNAANETVTE
jgi:hypothetical protein